MFSFIVVFFVCKEGGGNADSINWATLGWGYWTPYPFQPVVDKWKFLDSRRLTNVCDRWATNRTDDIQNAYFNGDGYETWENIWGIWNGIVPRDGEAIRRVSNILHYFGDLGFTNSQLWIPYIPYIVTNTENVFASQFIKNTDSTYEIVYLIVNRANVDCKNVLMQVNNTFDDTSSQELFIYDCYHGISIDFEYVDDSSKNQISFQFNIESLGYGCILMTYNDTSDPNEDLTSFLSTMYNLTNDNPLSKYSDEWFYLEQNMIDPRDESTKQFNNPPDDNSIFIPMSIYLFETSGVEIEGDVDTGVDFQFDWEMNPSRDHSQYIVINPFYIDKYPVTMYNYSNYLYQSKYKPSQRHNFLKNWYYDNTTDSYSVHNSSDNDIPVTYISLQEARDYCSFYGKRLPHSYEWQFAAQGDEYYLYPWGNELDANNYPPTCHNCRNIPGAKNINAYTPAADSPFGVSDLVGNVWQYTDEFEDIHTRVVLVKGSSNYNPNGSMWYFPMALELNTHGKYLLFDDSYERSGTLGFRCVAEVNVSSLSLNDTKPYNWKGSGDYCVLRESKNGNNVNFCGE